MRAYTAAAVLLLAVLAGHHGYYWLADWSWSPRVADAALSGVERVLLYAVIAGLLLQPALSVSARAAALVVVAVGAVESSQVAVCQAMHGITGANLRLTQDTCDALTGWPVGTAVAFACCALLLLFVAGSARRASLPAVPYSKDGVFVGLERRGRSPWKVLAALLAHPYAGCVWFKEGTGYRFDRVSGCLVADSSLRWQDFKLRPFTGDPALLREGLPWSIRHNCVTLR